MPNRLENTVGTTFLGIGYKEHMALDNSRPPEGKTDNKKLPPHGVDPKTYSFLLAAIDYNRNVKNIFDEIDATTRNLIGIYYGTDISLTELATSTNLNRGTAKNKILRGLRAIWASTPTEIQQAYPKEEVIKMKDPKTVSISPRVTLKRREAAILLWQDKTYRESVLPHTQNKKDNPELIEKIREKLLGRPSPFKGQTHTEESIDKIRGASQQQWTVRRFLKDNLDIDATQKTDGGKRLYENNIRIAGLAVNEAISFLSKLQQNPYATVHNHVSERDIKKIALSIITDMQKIFSTSSTDELKQRTAELDKRVETVKNQLRIKKTEFFEISKDERSMWKQIKENNLETKILQTGQITQQELNLIKDYFERRITREGLTIAMFDRFTIAAARVIP